MTDDEKKPLVDILSVEIASSKFPLSREQFLALTRTKGESGAGLSGTKRTASLKTWRSTAPTATK